MALQIQREFPRTGSVIWVTGASSGIGAALVKLLDGKGCQIVLSARNKKALEDILQQCKHPQNHMLLVLDLTDAPSFEAALNTIIQRFGRIDVLINNAGISHKGLATETSLEVDRLLMEVDYFGPVALSKVVIPAMKSQGQGLLITIASMAGKMGSQQRSAYSAAKHAVMGFMDSLRPEIYGKNIGVVVACPSFVKTNISHNAILGSGDTFGKPDLEIENGMTAERFVQKLIAKIQKGEEEIHIATGKPFWGYVLKRFSNNAYHRALRAFYRRKHES